MYLATSCTEPWAVSQPLKIKGLLQNYASNHHVLLWGLYSQGVGFPTNIMLCIKAKIFHFDLFRPATFFPPLSLQAWIHMFLSIIFLPLSVKPSYLTCPSYGCPVNDFTYLKCGSPCYPWLLCLLLWLMPYLPGSLLLVDGFIYSISQKRPENSDAVTFPYNLTELEKFCSEERRGYPNSDAQWL